nr:MAG TPA: hypothetical protein [Caudoviricetes sp.]
MLYLWLLWCGRAAPYIRRCAAQEKRALRIGRYAVP